MSCSCDFPLPDFSICHPVNIVGGGAGQDLKAQGLIVKVEKPIHT